MAVCAEVAGPVYVKLAQWAATRRDLLPESVCQTLARLQTRVSPHSWRATERLLKEEFGSEFDDFYQRLWLEERRPVASGCCAQVRMSWIWMLMDFTGVPWMVGWPGSGNQSGSPQPEEAVAVRHHGYENHS